MGTQSGLFFFYDRILRRVFKDQFLRVRCAFHRLQHVRQVIVKDLVHLEQVARRLLLVGDDERVHILSRHGVRKVQPLDFGRCPELSSFEHDQAHRPPGVVLLLDDLIKPLLRWLELKRDQLLPLVDDLQEVLTVYPRIKDINAHTSPAFIKRLAQPHECPLADVVFRARLLP